MKIYHYTVLLTFEVSKFFHPMTRPLLVALLF